MFSQDDFIEDGYRERFEDVPGDDSLDIIDDLTVDVDPVYHEESDGPPSHQDKPVAKGRKKKVPKMVKVNNEPKKRGRKKKTEEDGTDLLKKFSCNECNVAFQVR